jgi:hypothetical protein
MRKSFHFTHKMKVFNEKHASHNFACSLNRPVDYHICRCICCAIWHDISPSSWRCDFASDLYANEWLLCTKHCLLFVLNEVQYSQNFCMFMETSIYWVVSIIGTGIVELEMYFPVPLICVCRTWLYCYILYNIYLSDWPEKQSICFLVVPLLLCGLVESA